MRPVRSARPALLAATLLALAACGRNPRPDDAQPAPGPELATALEVRNNTWSDVDVFVFAGSHRVRVGDVVSMGAVRLLLPSDVLTGASVQIRTVPVGGGGAYTTDLINIQRGQRIRLTVERQLSLSTWSVDDARTGW